MSETTLVVGFGNDLMGDDGVGIEVARRLLDDPLPESVRVVACGSDSLLLPSLWRDEGAIWLVDAVVRGDRPGTLRILEHDQVLSVPQRHATVHHLSLPESLRWIRLAYPDMAGVRYRLFGVEPGAMRTGQGLSPPVARSAHALVASLRATFASC